MPRPNQFHQVEACRHDYCLIDATETCNARMYTFGSCADEVLFTCDLKYRPPSPRLRRTLSLGKRLQIYRCFFTNARPECDFKYFSSSAARLHSNVCLESPRPPLGRMRYTAVVVSLKAFAKVACRSRIESLRIDFALQDVDVSESHELELACRSVAREFALKNQNVRLRSCYAATAFARHSSRAKPGGEGS